MTLALAGAATVPALPTWVMRSPSINTTAFWRATPPSMSTRAMTGLGPLSAKAAGTADRQTIRRANAGLKPIMNTSVPFCANATTSEGVPAHAEAQVDDIVAGYVPRKSAALRRLDPFGRQIRGRCLSRKCHRQALRCHGFDNTSVNGLAQLYPGSPRWWKVHVLYHF
jgi:hypothetical protein